MSDKGRDASGARAQRPLEGGGFPGASSGPPIAVIGLACRFAGAADLQRYEALIWSGADACGPLPGARWGLPGAGSGLADGTADGCYLTRGGYLDDVRTFPALALGLPPRRVEVMDPQQRLALETGLQACADAGYRPEQLPRRTGVFLGVAGGDYRLLLAARLVAGAMGRGALGQAPGDEASRRALAVAVERVVPPRPYTAPGLLGNMVAATLAQQLDLRGPAYALDAACASSLLALFEAMRQLQRGELDAAFAGGVHVACTPELAVAFSRLGSLSAGGHCRPFDATADGFIPGEGAGVLLLKRLADARRDGDRIDALLLGGAVGSDGHNEEGPLAPRAEGQAEVLRRAWADAGVASTELGYLEANGTGARGPDGVELQGLLAALGESEGAQRLVLGSVKGAIGHTMAAAGVAGAIRAILALRRRRLPTQPGLLRPRAELAHFAGRVRLLTRPEPWEAQGPRRAGVSALAFGGTDVHLVLGEADEPVSVTATTGVRGGRPTVGPHGPRWLVPLSAPDAPALAELATRALETLAVETAAGPAEVARAWAARPVGQARIALLARDRRELLVALTALSRGERPAPGWGDGEEASREALARRWESGAAVDVSELTQTITGTKDWPACLPPATLVREPYWGVTDQAAAYPLALPPLAHEQAWMAASRAARPGSPPPPVDGATTPAEDPLREAVLEALIQVSAYPRGALRPDARLAEDLGLDSLMLAELSSRLTASLQPDQVLPAGTIGGSSTIGEVIDALRSALGEGPGPASGGAGQWPRPALVQAEAGSGEPAPAGDGTLPLRAEWTDPAAWPEVQALEARLDRLAQLGLRDPYFEPHEGHAGATTIIAGRSLLNFASYNYLGYAGDARLAAAVNAAVERYGTSVSASRLASGERPFHRELEAALAEAQGAEDALAFTAGHATNVTAIGHLVGPGDLVLHDELAHNSILQGARLSGASRRAFAHEDPTDLARLLRQLRPHHRRVLIAVEGVYSMDGDVCALPAFLRLKERHGCLLLVDEAHSFGVIGSTGRGLGEHWGVAGERVDLWMGTLSKSLASCGGWLAGSHRLIRYLRYTAPGFVFSAGLTPANGQAALTALRLMAVEPERVSRLQANARLFQAELALRGLNTGPCKGESAVVPVITGSSTWALRLSERLHDRGLNVQPIVHPAVPEDAARLRFFLSALHEPALLRMAATVTAEEWEQVRRTDPRGME